MYSLIFYHCTLTRSSFGTPLANNNKKCWDIYTLRYNKFKCGQKAIEGPNLESVNFKKNIANQVTITLVGLCLHNN